MTTTSQEVLAAEQVPDTKTGNAGPALFIQSFLIALFGSFQKAAKRFEWFIYLLWITLPLDVLVTYYITGTSKLILYSLSLLAGKLLIIATISSVTGAIYGRLLTLNPLQQRQKVTDVALSFVLAWAGMLISLLISILSYHYLLGDQLGRGNVGESFVRMMNSYIPFRVPHNPADNFLLYLVWFLVAFLVVSIILFILKMRRTTSAPIVEKSGLRQSIYWLIIGSSFAMVQGFFLAYS